MRRFCMKNKVVYVVYCSGRKNKSRSTRNRLKVCAPRFCCKVCALPCYPRVDWLIDWVNVVCTFFPFSARYHLSFRLHFCFIQSMITRPIGRLELAEFGRFGSGENRFIKCPDFEAYPRTQSINQPSNNMRVRKLWSKNGVRRLWGVSSYSQIQQLPIYTPKSSPQIFLNSISENPIWKNISDVFIFF